MATLIRRPYGGAVAARLIPGRGFVAVWLAVGLTGCLRLAPQPSRVPSVREAPDPYGKALQQALVRQHLTRVQTGTSGYRIGPNDILEVRVFGYDKMNMVARVSGNGFISFSPLGEVHASGLTDRQLEAVLEDRLRGEYLKDPHVTVFVKELHASEVAIVGAVQKPGQYLLLGEKRLIDLLTEAGGMTEKAGNIAFVIRFTDENSTGSASSASQNPPEVDPVDPISSLNGAAPQKRIKIDLDGLLLRAEEEWNLALKPGDLVNIPEAGAVHVTGTGVEKPGTYPLTRSTKTVRQIIDEAGGLKFEANRKLILYRKGEDGGRRVFEVDFKQIERDNRRDVPLHAGDILVTERTPVKTALASVGRALGTLIRFGIYGSWSVPIG